jgi:hypothetical protein
MSAMALHLLKLCVGVSTIEELQDWIDQERDDARRAGVPHVDKHTTRMIPKRDAELLDGGSLYWVIRGNVQARQKLLDIRPFTGADGIRRCDLVLEPVLVPTAWQPRRAFQGWRYLEPDQAPADLREAGPASLPVALRLELAALGLL